MPGLLDKGPDKEDIVENIADLSNTDWMLLNAAVSRKSLTRRSGS
jgi:hypothetical protein